MARKFRVSQKDHPLVGLIYEKGYTLSSFSEKLHYDESYIHQILNQGRRRRSPLTIERIAKGLGVDYYEIERLFDGTR